MSSGPGGGGKSLELMQRRLLSGAQPQGDATSNPQQPAAQQQPQQINPTPRPGKTSAALMATQAREQKAAAAAAAAQVPIPSVQPQQYEPQPTSQAATASRPKGKNFAAMMNRPGQNPPPAAPAPSPAPAPPVAAQAASARKGKDFSRMASRNQPIQQPQPPQQQQQPLQTRVAPAIAPVPTNNHAVVSQRTEDEKLRAQQLQASARAAAGLPPLETPTATSVTRVPPPIPSPMTAPTPSQAQHKVAARQVAASSFQRSVPGAMTSSRMAASPATMKNSAVIASRGGIVQASRSGSAPGSRGSLQTSTSRSPAKESHVTKTKVPEHHEGRLSSTTLKNMTGAPNLAPLVGQRIDDLVKSIDPNYNIDTAAEEQVLQLADDFLDKVTRQSQMLAKHRGSKTLDVQDIQIVLAKHWGITVPGLGLPNIRPLKPGKQVVSKTTPNSSGSQGNKRKASESSSGSASNRKKSGNASLSMNSSSVLQTAT